MASSRCACLILCLYFTIPAHILGLEPKEIQWKEERITGGIPAVLGEFPYMVSIRTFANDLGHFCGGALLSPNLVVTAGACTDPRSPQIDEIVAGTIYRTEASSTQQVRLLRLAVPHPGYVFPPYDDISLLFLDEPFTFNQYVSSIPLPEVNQSTFPEPVVIPGWGAEQYGLNMSETLMKVTVETYSDMLCEEWMGEPVPSALLCTGTNFGGKSACIGDAGGPLVSNHDGEVYVAGVLSHFACPEPNCCGLAGPNDHSPEIGFYIDWIMEQSELHGGGL